MTESLGAESQEQFIPQEKIDYIFNKIEELLNERSDEIPEKLTSSPDPDNKIKARKGVICALIGYYYILNKKGVIKDQGLSDGIDQAAKYFSSDEFKNKERTEVSDIERLNDLGIRILQTRVAN